MTNVAASRTNGTSRIRPRLAILVGGGPAPGINSVISSVTIEARKAGLDVIGIYDGFEHLVAGDDAFVRPLQIEDVSRIHSQGGSILRTSRTNPARSPEALAKVSETLQKLKITYLVTIGGDDTAFAAASVARTSNGVIRVAHVPKTIDNDLPLPSNMPTFGYESARTVGTEIVLTLMEDSRTTNRWFVVVVMGRKAGHLALGIGKAAGATVTIIPEEFTKPKITFDDVCLVLEGAMLKRRLTNQRYGVAIIAEGIAEKMDPNELEQAAAGSTFARDQYGHIALAEIPLAALIRQRVQQRFADRGEKLQITDVTLGYELRCHDPIPFDIDYTRTLGYGAVQFLMAPPANEAMTNGGFVCLVEGHLQVMSFADMIDPATGRTQVRLVDTSSLAYRVARDYMIRLEPEDLQDAQTVEHLARAAGVEPERFVQEFSHLFDADVVVAGR
jgi:6-phosphofructokinase